jgi:hypothetical protein
MYFDATPLNMTMLLIVALGVWALSSLYRGKYTSNLPLLFYACAFVMASTDGMNFYIMYIGLGLALVLRFEFMSKGFTKFVAFLSGTAIGLAALSFLDQIFGNGTMFS